MAVNLTDLEAMRDALLRARAAGVRKAAVDGKEISYQDDESMAAALADLERRIAAITGSRPATIRFSATKGL